MKRASFIVLLVLAWATTARAYIEAPYSLGRIINESTSIVLLRCEKLDTERNLIIYRKVRDIKGVYPQEIVKHNIGHAGFNPRESQFCMSSVAIGKNVLFFHNGSAGECCIDNYWYQVYPGGDWWNMQHGEPYLLRSYCGKPDKLADYVTQILAGKEVIVPCMMDGDKNALQLRQAKIQRLKASLKIIDYDPKRDFAGWGNDEFRRIAGLPGFSLFGSITRTDPGAWGIIPANLSGEGPRDLCIYGEEKTVLLASSGNAMEEASLPYAGGSRSACWGDYNGDGKLDLLLATPTGPKLLTNTGAGFRDDSALLPKEAYYNLTSAQFVDSNGDGRNDILLANGFLGLRLYRNKGNVAAPGAATPAAPKLSKWFVCGPFDNPNGTGFDIAYPPEKEINLQASYEGKGKQKVAWKETAFADGQVNSIAALFPKAEEKENAVAYLYRELDYGTAVELPASFGSDDTLTVWLNGEKIVSANVQRSCGPDQNLVTLKLRPGKNQLLLKVGQGSGEWACYYAAKAAPTVIVPKQFEDVSDSAGLGLSGIGSSVKGDRLLVADLNGDGKPDFLYCAGSGVVALNNGKGGFVELKDSGLNGVTFSDGRLSPALGDFNGDKALDLVVPQANGVRLFRNDGTGHFIDVTAQSGDLAKFTGSANCAIFADFSNKGRQDILVGCSKGPNRYFRSNGNGTFTDATDEIGLTQKVFNTRALTVFDMNKDGILDLAMNNEGQESAVLVGSPARVGKPAGK